MTTSSEWNGQNDSACSLQSLTLTEETTRFPIPTSLPPSNSLHAPHIPFELVVEILSKLPVKHLLQLRCVCKSWNSLIADNCDFAEKHLRLSTSSQDRHHLILAPIHPTPHPSPDLILLHSPISSIFSSTFTTTVKSFMYSIRRIPGQGRYGNGVSSCNGILCFRIDDSLAVLCNPSIRKFKILSPLTYSDKYIYVSYTLVYDRFINNYKIFAANSLSRKIEVNVHTLGTDYWRRIRDFPSPSLIYLPRTGTFVNDSINWLTYDSAPSAKFIVSLDIETESYQKLSLPVFDVTTYYMILGTLRGCLSLLYHRMDTCSSDIWIMKEHENEKSWIKFLNVPPAGDHGFYGYTKALYISKDDQVLMECLKEGEYSLVVYDSINNTFKTPKFQNNIHGETTLEVYVESLISPF